MLDRWVTDSLGLEGGAGRGALDERVLERLNEVIAYAAGSSAYYSYLKGVRVSSFEEFAALPFVFPEDVIKEGGHMLCVPAGDVKRIVSASTSGSSGEPKRVYFSEDDLESTVDYFSHGLDEFVVKGDRALILFPGNTPDGLCDLISRALGRLSCDAIWFGYPEPDRYDELFDTVKKENISFLIGTAGSMAGAARYSEEKGEDRELSGYIRGVLAAAAFVDGNDRLDIMRIWDCRFDEHYSMTETGYAGAVGCRVPGGYHVWESGVYYEVVDPASGEPAAEGAEGEVVVTTLTKRAMPFIRYRTGDTGSTVPGRCACGSCLKRLSRIGDRPLGKKFEPRLPSETVPFGR